MDPVSVLGLIQFSTAVLVRGYNFLDKVVKAPKETRQLLSEVSALNSVLDQLQSLNETTNADLVKSSLQKVIETGALDRCKEVLDASNDIIQQCVQVEDQKVKNFGRRLLWPLKEKDTKELLQRLHAIRDTISAAIVIDANLALQRVENVTADIKHQTSHITEQVDEQKAEQDRQKLDQWLLPEVTSPQPDFEAALGTRHKGTGEWLLNETGFKQWLHEKSNGTLWIHGIPGSGKTVLAATIIEHLQIHAQENNMALAYFYFKHNDENRQKLRSAVLSITQQILLKDRACYDAVNALYSKKDINVLKQPNNSEYAELIRAFSDQVGDVVIVLDALDESSEVNAILEWLVTIRTVFKESGKLRIVVSSRHEADIQRMMSQHASHVVALASNIVQDIHSYLAAEVKAKVSSGQLRLRNPELEGLIIERLSRDAGGMFLWARMQLISICRLNTDRAIKQALDSLPQGLDETYTRVLKSIIDTNEERPIQVKRIFQWLSGSTHPLTLEELAEAISIEPGDSGLDRDGIVTDPKEPIYACGGLVLFVQQGKRTIAQFCHYSVQEFLSSPRLKKSDLNFFAMDMQQTHTYLAEVCTRYIAFEDFSQPTLDDATSSSVRAMRNRITQYKMLRYAALEWPRHLRKCSEQLSEDEFTTMFIQKSLKWFIQSHENGNFKSWEQVLYVSSSQFPTGVPNWHHAVAYGLNRVLSLIFPTQEEINTHNKGGYTALHLCASGDHVEVAKRLLDAGANVDAPHIPSLKSALRIAAEASRVKMVNLFLEYGALPDSRNVAGSTPFYGAARAGSVEIMKMLYAKGADINVKTWDCFTPAMEAVEHGHLHVIEWLIEAGADMHVATRGGFTPMMAALASKDWKIYEALQKVPQPATSAAWSSNFQEMVTKLMKQRFIT